MEGSDRRKEPIRIDLATGRIGSGRTTGWIPRCSECGFVKPIHDSKGKAETARSKHRDYHLNEDEDE